MKDNKTVPVNSAEVEQKMADTFSGILKQRAAQYMPRDPNTAEAQQTLLTMIEGVLPPVSVCIKMAQTQLWPRMNNQEITPVQVAQVCADNIEKMIGITKVENLKLETCDPDKLVKAWGALAYFQKHSRSQGRVLSAFRNQIASVLMNREFSVNNGGAVHSATQVTGNTNTTVITRELPVQKKSGTEKGGNTADLGKKENHSRNDHRSQKSGGKKPVALIAIILVIMLVAGFLFYQTSRINSVEAAIDEIGTVTMESLAAIEAAEQSYGELSESLRDKVENAAVLTEARAEYERLDGKIREAVDAINAIGTVSLNSEKKIKTARTAYDALESDNLTGYVEEEYKTLTSAEELYQKYFVDSLYDSASASYQAGDYQKALAAYDAILAQYPQQSAAKLAKKDAADCLVQLAKAAYDEANYETAINNLKKARENYEDSEANQTLQKKVEEKLKKLRPSNGEIIEKNLSWGYGELSVTAGTHDICYKLVSKTDPDKMVMIFVQAGKSKSVKIKNGEYSLYYTSGEYWYGDDVGFGSDATYKKYTGTLEYSTHTEGNYIYYTVYELELFTDTTGNFATVSCLPSEFWD